MSYDLEIENIEDMETKPCCSDCKDKVNCMVEDLDIDINDAVKILLEKVL